VLIRPSSVHSISPPMPFSWTVGDTPDGMHRNGLYELYSLIHPQNTFRFVYSAESLNWALRTPGWNPDLLIGVRSRNGGSWSRPM
jgi:hypothetical protein